MAVLYLKVMVFTLLITRVPAIRKRQKRNKRQALARLAIKRNVNNRGRMMKNILKYWAPLYVYGAVIFYMSSLPHPLPMIPILHFDKFAHIVEYAVFGGLAARALKNSRREDFQKNFKVLAILASVAYAASDELHQLFVSCRDCSAFDLMADVIGGLVGVMFYNLGSARRCSYIHEL